MLFKNNNAIAIGDAYKDVVAAKSAGVLSVAALWGALNPDETLSAKPDHHFIKVSYFHFFLSSYFSI